MSSENVKLKRFKVGRKALSLKFVETVNVKDGVVADLYLFENDSTSDLAIVRVAKGHKTPLQRVMNGSQTIEGFLSGAGDLNVQSVDGRTVVYRFPGSTGSKEITVNVGEIMQWKADSETDLVFYELCYPPYQDGRFENLRD